MKRILYLSLIIIALLTGCTEKSQGTADIEIQALANGLIDSGCFSENLGRLDLDITISLYGIEESSIEDAVCYASTGATAEEIALFECADQASANAVETACEKRVSNQADAYKAYAPLEVEKLDNAVIRVIGNYVLLCVSNDKDAAVTVIDSFTQ